MCLVVAALEASQHYSFLLCANRDERHARPSAPARWWPDHPPIFGGRDLLAGGSWLAVDRRGRLAAVTNFRDPAAPPATRSRGALVADYLADTAALDDFTTGLHGRAAEYGPFSLLLRDGPDLRYASNRAASARLGRGVHGLSNAAFGIEWPKVRSARAGVEALLDSRSPLDALFDLLAQRGPPAQGDDRYRTAHFIEGATYGTRSSTVVLVDRDGVVTFVERSFDADARATGEVRETFALDPAAAPASAGSR
jgi:uncharacterized protein with NRDE domain